MHQPIRAPSRREAESPEFRSLGIPLLLCARGFGLLRLIMFISERIGDGFTICERESCKRVSSQMSLMEPLAMATWRRSRRRPVASNELECTSRDATPGFLSEPAKSIEGVESLASIGCLHPTNSRLGLGH
ncbi:hypothetical protein MPTK1_3g03950 [Marchantia polymorpha subsp. ruderalis]|uniref:Uncharacterized protein n=2 Tax=Marchantia polymorpha TaxID=3197 RepID=A0AAF6AX78_MARPO|nr:hypothetical protein MARPO_0022s0136 [Marchantia polymorpha]BBN04362.1 hypothetical protein Mp_3g03950 [Marchantia polymorpha subsp. ruderalis]|eukprot:PTQ44042.1 hypothetical protein MARPO_0022s0136 [Marchantia polymorpha]